MNSENIFIDKKMKFLLNSIFFNPQSGVCLKSVYLSYKEVKPTPSFPLIFRKACKVLFIYSFLDLINTIPDKFLENNLCNQAVIEEARKVLSDYFKKTSKSGNEVFIDIELLTSPNKYPFFSVPLGDLPEHNLSTNLKELNFPVRFKSFLKQYVDIKTVKDLLNLSIADLQKETNLGGKSVRDAQLLVYQHITGNKLPVINPEDKILQDISVVLNSQLIYEVFLEYYNYYSSEKITRAGIAKRRNVTTANIQQKTNLAEKKIFKSKEILKANFDEIANRSSVTEINSYLSELIQRNQLTESKRIFFYNLIFNSAQYNDKFKMEKDYLYPANKVSYFSEINEFIKGYINNEPVLLDEIIDISRNSLNDKIPDINYHINRESLSYISYLFNDYFIDGKYINNRILYNLKFSKNLVDVVYSAMSVINSPVHFKDLAKYIRSNNKVRSKTSDANVRRTLLSSDELFVNNRGVFILKTSNI
ncbi:MAG: hypothetical protein NTY74_14805 [Ignavibacteriae bacterium]|nr:hypothetical protein [Ignavibacteriota bacterium]